MISIRKSKDRGHFNRGWLDTYHTFSFDQYYDPAHMGFHSLRVINEDRVLARQGFPTHGHRDMEIVTYVLDGALEHKDSMGNGSIISPGEVQRMRAGTGVTHSEYNPSADLPVHLLQIWILPESKGLKPGYEQKVFPKVEREGTLRLIASRDGQGGSVTIDQDARVYAVLLDSGGEVNFPVPHGRAVWLQVAKGALSLNGHSLEQGDGAAIEGERDLLLAATEPAEILLFDLA